MATGDQNDMVARLRATLPGGWFPDTAPNLTAVLSGFAYGLARIYSTFAFAHLQSRIATAVGPWLDGIALDFFGAALARLPKGTRAGVVETLVQLTGRAPIIFEPRNPSDAGGYGHQGMTVGTGLAYTNAASTLAAAGGYGSLALPFQFFVTAYRARGGGIPSVAGYYTGGGWAGGGYGVGAVEYVGSAQTNGQITDAVIDASITAVLPAGTTAWTAISN